MLRNCRPQFPHDRASTGFTLVELLVAVAAGMLVMASLMMILFYAARSFMAVGNYADMNRTSRNALDIMNRDIRNAAAVSSYVTTNGVITSMTFTNLDKSTITYLWNSNATTFTRAYTVSGSTLSRVLLTNCDSFAFSVFTRTPSSDLSFSVATNASQVKIVYVDWKCSRQLMGGKGNTESIQTAQITLRN